MTDYREDNEMREWQRFAKDYPAGTFPTHKAVCPVCNGTGSHVNPAIDSNGITREQFDEDPDFMEDYMSGYYDVTCYTCRGANVVDEVEWDKVDPDIAKEWDEWCESAADLAACYAAERRMGC